MGRKKSAKVKIFRNELQYNIGGVLWIKIEETSEILQTVGMPKAQQADICCYVLLAMAGIKPDMSWSEATNDWIRIHDIIQFVNTFYDMSYAENSRETFRKQALHRFRTAA